MSVQLRYVRRRIVVSEVGTGEFRMIKTMQFRAFTQTGSYGDEIVGVWSAWADVPTITEEEAGE